MASSMGNANVGDKNVESKQLLYPDVFGKSYQEDRLRIVGKSNTNTQECLQTFSIPQSSVLSQIRSFLPQLSNANVKLAKDIETNPERADEINIECVDDDSEGKHIEMNLSMVPTAGPGASDESESESDDSSDDDGIDASNSSANQLSQETETQLRETKANEQGDLMTLKLPSKNSRKNKKRKAHIEMIESESSPCQEDSSNG